jgi:hypothetical protein
MKRKSRYVKHLVNAAEKHVVDAVGMPDCSCTHDSLASMNSVNRRPMPTSKVWAGILGTKLSFSGWIHSTRSDRQVPYQIKASATYTIFKFHRV